jgi:signal transduction histidine kinase/response regulator RpfG family c-di-GMP phosphodiesterase
MERVLQKTYQVRTATGGVEALDMLKSGDFSLLITDQRMPGMSGIELLRESQSIDPDLVRMLVTANTDNDTSFEAINNAGALRVIHKPWDAKRVLQFVQEALEHRETLIECKFANEEIEKLMQQLRPIQWNWDGVRPVKQDEAPKENPQIFFASTNDSLKSRFNLLSDEGYEPTCVSCIDDLINALQAWNEPSIVVVEQNSTQPSIDEVCRTIREATQNICLYVIGVVPEGSKLEHGSADDLVDDHISATELQARIKLGQRVLDHGCELAEQIKVSQEMYIHLQNTAVIVTQLTGKLFKEINDRTRAEEELRLQKILLESQSEASLDGVLVISVEGKIISHNHRFLEIWGLTEETANTESGETVLRKISTMLNEPEEFLTVVDYLSRYPEERSDKEITLSDSRIIHYYNAPVKSADHVLYGRAYYFRDITERKLLENQLRQAQKLESVGQLAAGIAHEINTPTQYVSDNTRFLRDAFEDVLKVQEKYSEFTTAYRTGAATPELLAAVDKSVRDADLEFLASEIPKAVEQSLDGTQRISKIVQSMKDFAHPGVAVKQACDLNKAIDSTITVACGEWKYVAEMVTDFDSTLPLIPCLQGEFNQVILNMIINASHAIGDVVGDGSSGKGKITISTRRVDPFAEIRIADTGAGIPESYRARIFDPFFTTKQVGKGTGQGLAISHHVVVDKHGGTITVESTEGLGTTFIIRLPLQDPSID